MKSLRIKHFKIWLGLLSLAGSLAVVGVSAAAIQAAMPVSVSEGYALLQKGWVNDAIAAFQRSLRENPRSLEARLGLAIAYQRAGQDGNAWQAYQRVLELDGNNKTALAALGVLGEYRPEWQATGITALTQLLRITPNDLEARSQRALLLGYQGRFGESLADYRILLQNNPKPEVLLGAAQIYAYSGNYTRSLQLFERYRSTGQSVPVGAVTAYALALQETGRTAEAVKVLEAQLKQKVSADQAIALRAALAQAYQANGQLDLALQVLQPLRSRPQATLPLARALSAIGRKTGNAELYQEAIALYRQALRQTTKPSPGLVTEVADVLGEFPPTRLEALSLYQQLIQQQPNDTGLQVKQLIVAQQAGQISRLELRRQLQNRLLSLSPDEVQRQAIAVALVRLDPPDPELLPIYENLRQSSPDVPFLNFRIAQMQLQRNDLKAAKQALDTYGESSEGARNPGRGLLLAEIERRQYRLEESARLYEAVIAENPPLPVLQDALWGLSNVRRSQGRLEELSPFYTRLLERDSRNARSQIGWLNLNYQLKKLSATEAETQLEQWLSAQSTPEPYPELLSLVAALPAQPKWEGLYTSLLALEPDSLGVETRLIQVIARRDPAQARERVKQVIERDRSRMDGYFLQGEVARTLGDLTLAAEAYQTILQRQPENVDALSALAGVRFEQKRYPEAETLYKRILVLRRNDPETQRVLADLYQAQDHPLAAYGQLQQLRSQQSTPTDAEVTQRIQDIKLDYLRRRGFQTYWERY
jgi:tetratricopeptide (TPR) repeat protein